MPQLSDLLQQGGANAWLFIASAILLGALHGQEPGHSKTMMAAFIIAVRGTVTQTVLLGWPRAHAPQSPPCGAGSTRTACSKPRAIALGFSRHKI
jgi:hypothetical protein